MALIADNIVGLFPFRTDAFAAAEEILKGLPHVAGVLKDTDGMILIHDLERFLSLEEEHALERALEASTP